MLASWVALVILFIIQGLNYLGNLTIKPTTLGWLYLIAAVVIIVDLFYHNRTWFVNR